MVATDYKKGVKTWNQNSLEHFSSGFEETEKGSAN